VIRKATLIAALSAALLAPLAVTTAGTAATVTGTTAGRMTAARQGLGLTITALTPEFARGQADQIKVSGTIRNDTGAPLSQVRVRLRYSAQGFTDRATMETYQADQSEATLPPSVSSVSSVLFPAVEAGASLPWEFTLTPAQLSLTAFGAYPIAVEVQEQGWRSLAVQRTFLTYAPPTQPRPPRNRLAVALPVIDQPHRADDATFADDKLSAELADRGRLAELARVAETAPKSVTWFVDPALFDDVNAMTKGYRISTKDGPATRPSDSGAAQWLADMRAALAGAPVVATPYADPDVTALAHQGFDAQTGRAMELGAQKATELIKPDVQTDVNWPAAGLIDADALDLLAVGKGDIRVRKVLLNSTNLPPQPPIATTPTTPATPDAATTLDTVNGPVTALVADQGLSRLFEPDGAASVLLSR
jgi:hypothetical protein